MEEEERKGYWGVKSYTCEDSIMKSTKHCLKREEEGKGLEIHREVILFKVHYIHV
jgi:hypothetical protein